MASPPLRSNRPWQERRSYRAGSTLHILAQPGLRRMAEEALLFRAIPIDQLVPHADNVRWRLGDLKDLTSSIASVGVVEPLLVSPREDGRYTVVAGHRRLAASQAAGLGAVPCTVRKVTDAERIEIMLAENVIRNNLTPIEEAKALHRLVEYGFTENDLAHRIGRSAKHIAGRLALLRLPRKVQARVHAGDLGVTQATALLVLKDHPDVISRLLADEWDRRNLERAVVREVARIEAEDKSARARAKLEAEGVPMVNEWNRHGPGGARQPAAVGSGYGELNIDKHKHTREPCHACHVTRLGEIVLLCTDPRRHRPGGESTVKAVDGAGPTRAEQRASARAEAKRRKSTDSERQCFVVDLAKRRLPRQDVLALALGQFLARATNAQAKSACRILAIDSVADCISHRLALLSFAGESSVNRERAALALALAAGEDVLRTGDNEGRSMVARLHLDFLAAYGWPSIQDPNGGQRQLRADAHEPPPD
jgi:ParB/RepB/Spo0J family partition protein